MDEPTLRVYVQKVTKKLLPEFSAGTVLSEDPYERIRLVLKQPVPKELTCDSMMESIKSEWPRKNEDLSSRNREEGNAAFQKGNNEMAVLLYTEAMKYAPVHETLWEGESMAIAAANR